MTDQTIIVTGGAGFIGSNAAMRYLRRGWHVVVLDNLSRKGAKQNLKWLESAAGDLELAEADVRDRDAVFDVFRRHRHASRILHLAAQVAVTTSVTDPRTDFDINALGAFNVLEAIRENECKGTAIYASTNKVYGEMVDLQVVEHATRYAYKDIPNGLDEERNLCFHSPYGCSKGSADQYFVDYHRIYGLNTVVYRQSCIYGYRQFGSEDQGWLAWFLIACALGNPITVYGDGKQVRDILFVEDLVDAYDAAFENPQAAVGRAFNIGGGPESILSILELLRHIESVLGHKVTYSFSDWRPGDQKVFVTNLCLARRQLGWQPKTSVEQGIKLLDGWITENLDTIRAALA